MFSEPSFGANFRVIGMRETRLSRSIWNRDSKAKTGIIFKKRVLEVTQTHAQFSNPSIKPSSYVSDDETEETFGNSVLHMLWKKGNIYSLEICTRDVYSFPMNHRELLFAHWLKQVDGRNQNSTLTRTCIFLSFPTPVHLYLSIQFKYVNTI